MRPDCRELGPTQRQLDEPYRLGFEARSTDLESTGSEFERGSTLGDFHAREAARFELTRQRQPCVFVAVNQEDPFGSAAVSDFFDPPNQTGSIRMGAV